MVRKGRKRRMFGFVHIHAMQTCHELLYSMEDKYSMADIKLLKAEISN